MLIPIIIIIMIMIMIVTTHVCHYYHHHYHCNSNAIVHGGSYRDLGDEAYVWEEHPELVRLRTPTPSCYSSYQYYTLMITMMKL